MHVEAKRTGLQRYLACDRETDWAGLGEAIGAVSQELRQVFERNHLERAGPATLVYCFQNDPHRPEGKYGAFVVSAQWIWSGESLDDADIAPARVVTWDDKLYLTAMHHGSIENGILGWVHIRDYAEERYYRRTLVEREVYHVFKGPKSSENRIELQLFVE